MKTTLSQRLGAEALGTAFLVAAVVGSGIMAARLAGGNAALALLCNTLPTGAILVVLILALGPVSGAHFNPVVTLAFFCRSDVAWQEAALYAACQVLGGILGALAAHAMFDLPLWQVSQTVRTGPGQWLAEGVATFGLVLTIFCCLRGAREAIPYAVGLYITSAYWFTASTSFANPAVTIARALSNTFAGIAPVRVSLPLRIPSGVDRILRAGLQPSRFHRLRVPADGGLTFPACFRYLRSVGFDRSHPASPRHFAQALHFARSPGEGWWRNVKSP